MNSLALFDEMWFLTAGPVVGLPMILAELPREKELLEFHQGAQLSRICCLFVLETIRTGTTRVIHITVKTEETQRLRIKFVLYCPT